MIDNNDSIIDSTMDGTEKTEQTSTTANNTTAPPQVNVKMVQNVHLIWLDNNIDEDDSVDCRNTIIQLRQVINTINKFTDAEKCIDFINTVTDNKACVIIPGSLKEHIVPQIHHMSQVDSIFIYCGNKISHEQWATNWSKIKGVFTEISSICQALKQAAQECEQNAIPISFVATSDIVAGKNLDKLDPPYMYTQLLKEILLSIEFEPHHIS